MIREDEGFLFRRSSVYFLCLWMVEEGRDDENARFSLFSFWSMMRG